MCASSSVAMASAGTYLWADIHNGQVGTLLLLACLVWMTLTIAGRSFWGGIVLSTAIALKLYPALLVPYLILRRDVRGLLRLPPHAQRLRGHRHRGRVRPWSGAGHPDGLDARLPAGAGADQ